MREKSENEKFCSECGEIINIKAEICPKCGVRQMAAPSSLGTIVLPSGRNRTVAVVFAMILGGIGAHKFYLGKTLQGVLYALFCLTFIPAFVGFIEGIMMLMMTDEQFAAKYPTT